MENGAAVAGGAELVEKVKLMKYPLTLNSVRLDFAVTIAYLICAF